MTIGASIACLVAGAILTFAIETDSAEGININSVGIILMVAGVIGLVLYAVVWGPRTRPVARPVQVIDDRRVVEPVTTPVVRERVVEAPAGAATPVAEHRTYR